MIRHALLALALVASAGAADAADGVFLDLDFDAARARARERERPVMVDFFTTWCGPCKKLDAVTWPDARVQRWLLENVVPVKIDADRDARTKSLYEVNLYPSIVFVGADGVEIGRLQGFVDPEKFLSSARLMIAGAQDGNALAFRATGPEEDVPETRLAYANWLASKQRFGDAAAHYLWCFDEGARKDAAFAARRRGEVLDHLTLVSRTWIRAKQALRERRQAAHERLMSEEGTIEDARDLAALDAHLQQGSATLEAYLALVELGPSGRARARGLLDAVFEALIGPRRYADVLACEPDFAALLDVQLAECRALEERFRGEDRARSLLDAERSAAVGRGTLAVEALLGAGETARAEALGEKLVALDPTARTFLALARRARRAEATEAALAWTVRGLEVVPEEQRTSLEILRKTLERELGR